MDAVPLHRGAASDILPITKNLKSVAILAFNFICPARRRESVLTKQIIIINNNIYKNQCRGFALGPPFFLSSALVKDRVYVYIYDM